MYLKYGLIEGFTLTQITFGILDATDLRLQRGKFYCVTKAKRVWLENEN